MRLMTFSHVVMYVCNDSEHVRICYIFNLMRFFLHDSLPSG